jgi:hypothetical protein
MSAMVLSFKLDISRAIFHLPGRFSRGAQLDIIVIAPVMIPAAPSPATARPTINMSEEVAAPHSTDPSSKMPKKTRNVHCDG